jgi:hypothetical protein
MVLNEERLLTLKKIEGKGEYEVKKLDNPGQRKEEGACCLESSF